MQQEQNFQPFGYSEMYEWKNLPDKLPLKDGLFVQFSESEPEKIEKYHGGVLCGVTSACFTNLSDNPIEWSNKSKTDAAGGYIREKKYIAVGNKGYDQNEEINIVRTFPYKIYKKQNTDEYDEKKQYIQRINRLEWQPVTLLGKCIVQDDGTCVAGGWASPLETDEFDKCGMATKSYEDGEGYYVLKRVTPNSVLILIK